MKKSMKVIAIAIIPVLVLTLSACGKSKDSPETKSLYAQGLEIIQLMSEITQSEQYVDLYYTGNREIKAVVENISAGDYTAPKNVYAITITDENLTAMAELEDLRNASSELKSFLMQRILNSLATQINSMGGVEALAATSICTVEKTFVDENADENVIYLYTYDNANPVAVTFLVGEDHAISANGVFIMYDGFPCDSADEIKTFFRDITVEVNEVLPEK